MSIRRTLLAVAVAACAFAALPSVASAYFMDLPENTEFTVANEGKTTLRAGETEVTCQKVEGSGSFADKHSGSITLTFKECKSAGTNCTSSIAGTEKAGEIMTTTLPFDVVKVTHEGVAKPGILITPGPETVEFGPHFATFKCAFGLVTAKVGGNGVIGTLTSPKNVGEFSNKFGFAFEATEKNEGKAQTHVTAHDTTGKVSTETIYQLQTTINGGKPIASAQIGNGSITFKAGEGAVTGE